MAAKKTETVKARFQEAIDTYKKLRDFDYVTPLQAFRDEPISESDRNRVQKSFVKVLSERFGPKADFSMKLAFEAADLDPQDPVAREVLLQLFAISYFPSGQTTRGAKRKWTPQRWSQLLSDYDQVKTDKPKLGDEQLCKEIVKRFPSRYPKPRPSVKDAGATIRRNLAYARDPLKNTLVAEIAQLAVEILHELDPNVDFSAQKIRQSELFAIKWLSKAWKRERNLAK